MNAIAPCLPASAEDNIRMLQELIGCGIKLALAVSEKALQLIGAPDPAEEGAVKSRVRTPDPTLLFLRLWASIRQTMAMQSRLAAARQPSPANRTAPNTPQRDATKSAAAPGADAIERLARELSRSGKAATLYATSHSPAAKGPAFPPDVAGKR